MCQHVLSPLASASAAKALYKDECVLCFRSAKTALNVCLHCFQGYCNWEDGCSGPSHTAEHFSKLPTHYLFLSIKMTPKEQSSTDDQPAKITRLEIAPEPSERELYDTEYSVYCAQCDKHARLDDVHSDCKRAAMKVIDGPSAALKAAQCSGDSWTEPSARPCEHGLLLEVPQGTASSSSSACSQCDLKQNLWLCLSCGTLNCGRRQFDGSGGNGHALSHFQSCGHPLACKLGTITAEGSADVYCYACDDLVLDANLKEHLACFGIDLASARKTEQSTAELQLSINLTHTYAMVDQAGQELRMISAGPGYRGFANLGNSCYMATVLQALRNVPDSIFQLNGQHRHEYACCELSNPADCLSCQVLKLARGIYQPGPTMEELRPWMFKQLIGKGHAGFSSAAQQDAAEFLAHLQRQLAKQQGALGTFVASFEFEQMQRLTCQGCGAVRRSREKASAISLNVAPLLPEESSGTASVSLTCLLDLYFSAEEVEIKCAQCSSALAQREVRLVSVPQNLTVTVNRYRLRNWVPEKSNCEIVVDTEGAIDLSSYMAAPEDVADAGTRSARLEADPELLGQLLLMGLEEEPARKALISCNNASVEEAMQLLFSGDSAQEAVDGAALDLLVSAGFSAEAGMEALRACGNCSERAFDYLLSRHGEGVGAGEPGRAVQASSSAYRLDSFITHRGASMHCGHYVAHLRDEAHARWVLYNDEKVAEAALPLPAGEAYIYLFTAAQ